MPGRSPKNLVNKAGIAPTPTLQQGDPTSQRDA